MIDLRCEYLSVRCSQKLQMLRLFRGRRSLTCRELKSIYSLWNENMKNNIPDFHFPGAIKIVATKTHYCYCLMAYGKWRPITWYRIINKTFYFSAYKCLKLMDILFILKLHARIGIFTKFFCIWKRLKELFLEEELFISELPKICGLICRNFPCPRKSQATCLHSHKK